MLSLALIMLSTIALALGAPLAQDAGSSAAPNAGAPFDFGQFLTAFDSGSASDLGARATAALDAGSVDAVDARRTEENIQWGQANAVTSDIMTAVNDLMRSLREYSASTSNRTPESFMATFHTPVKNIMEANARLYGDEISTGEKEILNRLRLAEEMFKISMEGFAQFQN